MFFHSPDYSTIRHSLCLGSENHYGEYVPSAALVLAGNTTSLQWVSKDEIQATIAHELYHCRQISATTSGIVLVSLLSLRSAIFEKFTRVLNEKFSAGLWTPILGWMNEVYSGNPQEFYDPGREYYYISKMKRNIGMVDSALFAIGAFESDSEEDCKYWANRFLWNGIFTDGSGMEPFKRYAGSMYGKGWWPIGVMSLLEATALYIELLRHHGSVNSTNRAMKSLLQDEREARGTSDLTTTDAVSYFGPFLVCEQVFPNASQYPYHFVPIAAFWAMNSPLPHVATTDGVKVRQYPNDVSWADVEPGHIFWSILYDLAATFPLDTEVGSLLEIVERREPFFWTGKTDMTVSQVIDEDIAYVESVVRAAKNIGSSFPLAFQPLNIAKTWVERTELFLSHSDQEGPLPGIEVCSPQYAEPAQQHIKAYLMSVMGEHLIPTWSYGNIPRFYFGHPFTCPSITSYLSSKCPALGLCNGQFPDTRELPASCWFQDCVRSTLQLEPTRIGIVSGEIRSETHAREQSFWEPKIRSKSGDEK